ncbi:hypothetical protein F5Y03DRAFT_408959 [Xylaria venustula]|nr:hypothetical protein F5Y03DRAFT_408959 [Xylaria venustula]
MPRHVPFCKCESTSFSSNADTEYTPSATTTDDVRRSSSDSQTLHHDIVKLRIGEVPEPGHIYMIRDLVFGRLITLMNGKVELLQNEWILGGCYWICDELESGWTGFRNAVSGKYLGRTSQGNFSVGFINAQFVLRPSRLGGYNLCMNCDGRLTAAAIESKDKVWSLVEAETSKDAARWEFIKLCKDFGVGGVLMTASP